ncbi:hypothetical protein GCM10008957_48060 [Deinococcus ruber]|uniref:Uncharacterized protein n=1 Tax=Deinococcus ruber TaxID=1848197 RepID=A0A918CNH3_9DEIO|nr:hypothetical protein GCM10008957_48060 [Deinococcus ruber]
MLIISKVHAGSSAGRATGVRAAAERVRGMHATGPGGRPGHACSLGGAEPANGKGVAQTVREQRILLVLR